MIEEQLLNYGILGLWTLSLLYEKFRFQNEIKKLISKNNQVLAKVAKQL
jgi:hypothetical protein